MSGRRLLDAFQFLNVSKNVAAKHLAIRQHQLDRYTRTSSLTKGIKDQTEGLILTAQAAAALARRVNDPSPPPPPPSGAPSPADSPSPNPSPNSAPVAPNAASSPSSATSLPSEQARILQRRAEFQVPASAAEYQGNEKPDALNVSNQQDVFYEPSQHSTPGLSALPRVKVPKATGDAQEGGTDGLNADVFQSAVGPDKQAAQNEQPELPEEMMQGLFHSRKVSSKLSGKPIPEWKTKNWRQAGNPTTTATTPSAQAEAKAHAEVEEMEKLGASVAEDITPASEVVADVNKDVAYQMMESRVPSSRLARLWQYGGLATSMAFGAVGETVRRATGSQDSGSIMFSAGNMERLVGKLSKMRGAALKLGQMLSFQGAFCPFIYGSCGC